MDRLFLLAAGISGAAGVGLSAAAAHMGGGNVGTAATFLLAHAPAFLAASFIRDRIVARYGAAVLLVGVIFFSGDLLAREFLGQRLFPYAAPAGGILMIAGWLAVALSALTGRGSS
ncbi:DUF423 domain-containing protein [Aquamicrobium sp. LC103]|uniref:DUF423 domain-containing protein n=1 Tax=Aquamicrobium sp. LC103 TaxID=1120658 RepID=UPI00063E776F|nr:DUF423 domain-containing protein [Aquamicrobium sp. LC103]TKT81386.1 DUF423 domain-containing protein [Aquamicrobium sp. LC103]